MNLALYASEVLKTSEVKRYILALASLTVSTQLHGRLPEPRVFGQVHQLDENDASSYHDNHARFNQFNHPSTNGDLTQTLAAKQEGVAQLVEQRTFNP
jgi:hypothetical protein